MDLKFHEIAETFPMMGNEAIASLGSDIHKHGILVPIEIYEGRIIDGRNRYLAARTVKHEFTEDDFVDVTETVNEQYGGSLAAYVNSLNHERRHLTGPERAICAGKLKKRLAAEAKERMRQGGRGETVSCPGKARDKAGEVFQVSGPTVDAAAVLVDKGTPALVDAVNAGKISVSGGRQIAEQRTPEEQDEIAKRRMGEGRPKRKTKTNKTIDQLSKRDALKICREHVKRAENEITAGRQFLSRWNANRPPSRQLQFDFGD